MNTAAQGIIEEPTTPAEEEALKRIYPWRSYAKDLMSYQEFRGLEEMCAALKVDAEAVKDAVRFRQGKMGSYHFVHC